MVSSSFLHGFKVDWEKKRERIFVEFCCFFLWPHQKSIPLIWEKNIGDIFSKVILKAFSWFLQAIYMVSSRHFLKLIQSQAFYMASSRHSLKLIQSQAFIELSSWVWGGMLKIYYLKSNRLKPNPTECASHS